MTFVKIKSLGENIDYTMFNGVNIMESDFLGAYIVLEKVIFEECHELLQTMGR